MSQSIRRALYKAKGLPDPGPTPTHMMREFTIVVSREAGRMIDSLYEMVRKEYPTRNDFLGALLKGGVAAALEFAEEAAAAAAQTATAPPAAPVTDEGPRASEITITNPDIPAEEREQISARLRALRGADLQPSAAYRERPAGATA